MSRPAHSGVMSPSLALLTALMLLAYGGFVPQRGVAAAADPAPSALPAGFHVPEPVVGAFVPIPGEPAAVYRVTEPLDGEDQAMAAILKQAAPGATYSPSLARAARAAAAMSARSTEGLPPNDTLKTIAEWAGSLTYNGYTWSSSSSSGHEAAFVTQFAKSHRREGPDFLVGIAHVAQGGTHRWLSLFGTRDYELAGDFPRAAAAGTVATLRFRLPANNHGPSGWVLPNEGEFLPITVTEHGGIGEARIPFGPQPGPQQVEMEATGPSGHRVVLNLTVYVGEAPRGFQPVTLPDEGRLTDNALAERYALDVVNDIRAKRDLAPFQADSRLTEIARGHTRDMLAHGYFGHTSPTAGTVKDRFDKAKYGWQAYGENIGRHRGVYATILGLMKSPGHRKILLSPKFTHLGIGLELTRNGSGTITSCTMTQDFAVPK